MNRAARPATGPSAAQLLHHVHGHDPEIGRFCAPKRDIAAPGKFAGNSELPGNWQENPNTVDIDENPLMRHIPHPWRHLSSSFAPEISGFAAEISGFLGRNQRLSHLLGENPLFPSDLRTAQTRRTMLQK